MLALSRAMRSAHIVISENKPSNAEVMSSIARSEEWRRISTPRCPRTFWSVVSVRQWETNQPRMMTDVTTKSIMGV
jgi:hypothetical protein